MFRHDLLCTAAAAMVTCATAAEQRPVGSQALVATPSQGIEIPGTGFVVGPGAWFAEPGPGLPDAALMTAMANWLSVNFGLPPILELPRVELVPQDRMMALRFRKLPSERRSSASSPDLIALYSDDAATIYLPDKWSATSPADLSVLVHEMVHHMQREARIRFACSEAREEMAFAAQAKWLELFGGDLLTDFGLDPLTLRVRTRCLH